MGDPGGGTGRTVGVGTGVGEGRVPRPDAGAELTYFSTHVSRRSTYWTGISL